MNNDGIQIFFLLFKNIFKVAKQNFRSVILSNSFLDKKCDKRRSENFDWKNSNR